MNLPGDPSLPPGCTMRQIDERFGNPRCVSCEAEIEDDDDAREHPDFDDERPKCLTCLEDR